ncbi:hypothetical protein AGR7B_Lc60011 [Agrobacterium deltaense RV3]|nr:hypothetical protein AGR7B_Lc60011 [Agrobacterium deltaense RV3]
MSAPARLAIYCRFEGQQCVACGPTVNSSIKFITSLLSLAGALAVEGRAGQCGRMNPVGGYRPYEERHRT